MIKPYYSEKGISLYLGNCLKKMKKISDNSIDAVVTDPPYEFGFMGKAWDKSGIAYNPALWKEVLRILKPGGHLLSFGGSRTYHRMACAIEDAGFEIRDQIMWIYGSGFPKSLNIGKAIDKAQGNEREVVGTKQHAKKDFKDNLYAQDPANANNKKIFGYGKEELTKGISEWEGWGTALKPAHEPICLARKPVSEKTVAKNVLKYGTGGINIDGCRVEAMPRKTGTKPISNDATGSGSTLMGSSKNRQAEYDQDNKGRFPANLIHDGSPEVLAEFAKTGVSKSHHNKADIQNKGGIFGGGGFRANSPSDAGTPARFFYCAKASKRERDAGCKNMDIPEYRWNNSGICQQIKGRKGNFHPTVKPLALMKYLIALITRSGQVVLDPFAGSGSTLIAIKELNRRAIGIEISKEYCDIAVKRIKNAMSSLF